MPRDVGDGFESSFGAVPPGTVLAKDKLLGRSAQVMQMMDGAPASQDMPPGSGFQLQPVIDQLQAQRPMESMREIEQMRPVDPNRTTLADLNVQQLQQIQAWVEGRPGAQPPQIPGFTPQVQQQNPWANPNPYAPGAGVFGQQLPPQFTDPNMAALLQQANMQQVPQQQPFTGPQVPQLPAGGSAQPPPAAAPNYADMMKPLIEAMQAQTQAMMQPLVQQQSQQQALLQQLLSGQQQYYAGNADVFRAQQIQSAGLDPTNPVNVAVYNLAEQNQQLMGKLQQMEQHFSYLQQQAQNHVTESSLRQQIQETISAKFPKVKIPDSTIKSAAKTAAALAGSLGSEHAVKAALEGVFPLMEQLAAIPQPQQPQLTPQQAMQLQQYQAPNQWQQPVHPGLAQLQQLPQFAGMSQSQLSGVLASMQATAIGGNGAGRFQHQPITLDQMDSLFFN